MISFIVPAHNEEALLAHTLEAIHRSAGALKLSYEVIVADDASTDSTPQIARRHGATVVSVKHRQIAATRNSGARGAKGEFLFFVDADTTCDPKAVAAALREMQRGAVGGGAPTWADSREELPLYVRPLGLLAVILPKLAGFTGGAFMFCTREAFLAVGGFNERLFWAEESAFALALKREGRFAVLWQRVITSGRRFRKVTGLQLLIGVVGAILFPRKMFTSRSSVEKVWYDSDRTTDEEMPKGLNARLGNAITFVVIAALLTGPIWNFVPRSLTPLTTYIGKYRMAIGITLSHIGLLLWPVALLLLVNLVRQKRWTSVLHSLALIGFCGWQGWCSARTVLWAWTWLFDLITGQRV
jgi:glycosyltransferase involved in cell wall biosynthesis